MRRNRVLRKIEFRSSDVSGVFVVHIIVPRYPFLQGHIKDHVSGRRHVENLHHPFLQSQFVHHVRLKTMTVLIA